MVDGAIEKLYTESKALLDFLTIQKELSFKSDADNLIKKTLLMAAASYFEDEIKKLILEFVKKSGHDDPKLTFFVENKAINRQYHTYFSWDQNNANSFLGLFGDKFRNDVSREIEADPKLKQAVREFLDLGNSRNKLVHGNFSVFSLEKTFDEVYEQYKESVIFLDFLRKKF